MTDRFGLLGRTALASMLFVYAGCAPEEEKDDKEQVAGGDSELIGGVAANSPSLNAIGTLGVTETYTVCGGGGGIPPTYDRLVCSASLIAPRVVLTAKHCVDSLLYGGPNSIPYFGIGPDALRPTRKVPIVQIERSPVDVGGFNGYGRDVAVVYLGEAVTDVRPLGIAELTTDAIGQRFGAIGYGVQDNAGNSGTRMAGSVTVNALEGRVFELIFGNYEAFRDWFISSGGPIGRPPIPPPPGVIIDGGVHPSRDGGVVTDGSVADAGYPDFYEMYIRSRYENTLLLPGYEAYVGNRRGDAQLCRGDSGSPLVRSSQGQLYAYGVVSGGIHSRDLTCDYGAVYASFGPETVQFLQNARNWVDPCEGVTENGQCDGDVATRCTGIDEGRRRLTVTDCSLLGQTCAVGSDGRAACAAPGEPPVVIEEPDPCEGYPDYPGYPGYPPGVIIDEGGVIIGRGESPSPF